MPTKTRSFQKPWCPENRLQKHKIKHGTMARCTDCRTLLQFLPLHAWLFLFAMACNAGGESPVCMHGLIVLNFHFDISRARR